MDSRNLKALLFFTLLMVAAGCTRPAESPWADESAVSVPDLPDEPIAYSEMAYPESWLNDPALQLFGGTNPGVDISDAGATLGRILFHDVQLSVDNTVSCSTCHRQENAFSDPAWVSTGVSGSPLPRNASSLFNLDYQRRLLWDLRVTGLINQVLEPIAHPDEMGMSLDVLPEKLASLTYYPDRFEEAFGDPAIDEHRIANALAQFLLSIRSTSSRYDEGLADGFASFTESELLGKSVFFRSDTRCNQCHSGLNFFSTQPAINGLETDYAAAGDGGIGALTGDTSDDGRFKTVSLRNVGWTAPYMHDGRLATLREVVDFYSDDIQPHPFLDERLSESGIGPPGQTPYHLDLSEAERQGLVDFLHTLSDTVLVTDPALSNPF